MRRFAFFPASFLALVAACSTYGSGDAAPVPDTDQTDLDAETDPADAGSSALDASDDAAPPETDGGLGTLTYRVPHAWRSPNGAVIAVNEEGTRITGYTQYNHPVIVPDPAIDLTSDDYTVTATVRAGAVPAEFGIITRSPTTPGAWCGARATAWTIPRRRSSGRSVPSSSGTSRRPRPR